MAGQIVHFEVITSGDPEELFKFYGDTFGWKVDGDNEFKYGMVSAEDAGIGGGIGGTPDPSMESHVTFYIQVPDPAATIKDIESRGGKLVMGPEEILPGTTIALFRDPHGNLVGLTKGE
jgi:predicted enzyme related to lactoylglutathione lyase